MVVINLSGARWIYDKMVRRRKNHADVIIIPLSAGNRFPHNIPVSLLVQSQTDGYYSALHPDAWWYFMSEMEHRPDLL